MYKMIVSDFYDTLVNKEESIDINTMLEIDRVRKNNVLFVVATSRLFRTIMDYNSSYIFSDYIISYNGSYIYDCMKDKVIYQRKIPVSILKKLIKLKQFDLAFLSLNETYYTNKDYRYDYGYEIKDLNEFLEYEGKKIYEVIVHYKKKDEDEIIKYIKNLDVNYFFRKNGKDTYIEIVYNDIDKYEGVKMLASKLDISNDEIISIGASSNDYELIKNTFGICVANGEKEIKKISKAVTSNKDTFGVREVISKYFE